MQKALMSIHWAYKCDPEIIQMQCKPTKGLHTLIRTMAMGSVEEKDNSMITLYLAILRADAARWKIQNKALRREYRNRGIIADHTMNLIYRRTHELVPGDEYRQYTAKILETSTFEEENDTNKTCPQCGSQIQLQLTCNKCKQCLKCMNIAVCRFAPRNFIDALPPTIRKWARVANHTARPSTKEIETEKDTNIENKIVKLNDDHKRNSEGGTSIAKAYHASGEAHFKEHTVP
jgi:ssDNA-binding Zn-finger/Zn-ribbon topoisomerase 1